MVAEGPEGPRVTRKDRITLKAPELQWGKDSRGKSGNRQKVTERNPRVPPPSETRKKHGVVPQWWVGTILLSGPSWTEACRTSTTPEPLARSPIPSGRSPPLVTGPSQTLPGPFRTHRPRTGAPATLLRTPWTRTDST